MELTDSDSEKLTIIPFPDVISVENDLMHWTDWIFHLKWFLTARVVLHESTAPPLGNFFQAVNHIGEFTSTVDLVLQVNPHCIDHKLDKLYCLDTVISSLSTNQTENRRLLEWNLLMVPCLSYLISPYLSLWLRERKNRKGVPGRKKLQGHTLLHGCKFHHNQGMRHFGPGKLWIRGPMGLYLKSERFEQQIYCSVGAQISHFRFSSQPRFTPSPFEPHHFLSLKGAYQNPIL